MRRRANLARGLAMALVVALAGVFGGCSIGPSAAPIKNPPIPSPTSAPRPTATRAIPGPTATATLPTPQPYEPSPSGTETEWRRLTALDSPDLGDPDMELQMEAVAARPSGAVGIGVAYVCCTETVDARAWFSPDGVAWTRVAIGAASATYADVTAGPHGYIVVGWVSGAGGPRAAGWWSSDGRAWKAATVPDVSARLTTVEAALGGYLALARVEGAERGAVEVWASADGRSWARLSEPDALGEDARASDIASGPAGLVIVGATFGRNPGATWQAATWTSADGRSWTPNPTSGVSGSEMQRVVWLGDRFVAVGNTVDDTGALGFNPAAWISADGRSWEPVAVPGGDAGRAVVMRGLAVGVRGVVAVGPSPEGSVGVWVSTDGRTWVLLPDGGDLAAPTPDLIGTFEAADVAVMGNRLLAVGSFPGDQRRGAAVWVNPPPD